MRTRLDASRPDRGIARGPAKASASNKLSAINAGILMSPFALARRRS
jgi:hypothetical protein